MINYKTGQRWISEMEPELGLGIVKQIDKRVIKIHFPASECERIFAIASAPLKRVEFKAGDAIKSREGLSFIVESTSRADGIITYHGENCALPENELCDNISFTTPQNRMLNGFFENNRDFNLRYRSLLNQYRTRKSSVRGFIGGRIDLIPHQLYVASEIASRHIPRVLLSDETGLGKTIEVCLILQRLLINERINRVLILLPDSLVHQWFIELIRRFSLVFRIFDKDYCESIESSDPDTNPFLEDQAGICCIDFLAAHGKWKKQAIAAKWDMLIIDEAHHLTVESPAYNLAKQLSLASKGLMLLTATPEQLGHRSHFARLHLLDPARYHDFDLFEQEEKQYQNITGIINKLLEAGKLNNDDIRLLAGISPEEFTNAGENFAASLENNENFRNQFIEDLLDRHGTGRAVFRNTRAAMTGFPKRVARLIPLKAGDENLKCHTAEFKAERGGNYQEISCDYKNDPRINWLVQFLKKHKTEKVLLICRSIDQVQAIEDALRKRIKINPALFHENLTLLQRDRNAAWFARDNGAQILICSEIGSEGRNFQFSHQLVLFDLPLDPELLEQRIGRLDRIGQTQTIFIHIPYLVGSEYEILARWYHEGLNAFEKNIPGVYRIFQKTGARIIELASGKKLSELDEFIKITQKQSAKIAQKLKKGQDRLVELNSFRPGKAESLVDQIETVDNDKCLEKFMLNIFQFYEIDTDRITDRTYRLNLSLLTSPEFPLPALKQDYLTVTFDRKIAISREDIEFLSWDHPMVIGVMDLILGSEKGNCTLAIWPDKKKSEILLEAIFVLECVAPKSLYADRFLPPTPVRIVVNHLLQDCCEKYPVELFARRLKNSNEMNILDSPQVRQELFPEMLNKCKELAQSSVRDIINDGLHLMETNLTREARRLVELKKVNKNIGEEEISFCQQEIKLLREAILSARFRLDALRLISRGQL